MLESPPPAGFSTEPPPIHVVESPAFLLFVYGDPVPVPPGDSGLELVSNANFPLFRDTKGGAYYLLSGEHRYSAAKLQGPWNAVTDLPAAFRKIPARGEFASLAAVAAARASVPGTLKARRAVLEAQLPVTKTVKAGAAPDVTVSYAGGEPKFEPIPGTQVARAVNTGNDIIRYGDKYYLVYEGMWYVADKPTGPWAATADVPAAVYEIPPSSPAYPVTQTAWDGDEWASSGGTYNPRTGISTETDRYFSEDSNKMKMERTVQGPGGNEMDVKKTTDFDTGTRTTERTTDRGGSSEVTRQRQAGGGRIEDVGVGTGERRYGGSGSLESRTGTATRPATTNYNSLNRDAAARSGGYQNYERRTSTRSTGMSRGMRPRRR